ncbi:D-glycero-D-manno-heptose 1,7-bisphosphate phosphatase/D-glycero-alpha-D-manno-heptose 1-phosphate guanylyltransferase [Arachidicoccus rhizosphaerae]|uniref:D,D-heptose 1,7-bisphosphate phosphatase n=1 Tax=Arachidicoccus rhizosphaerae TaxID=551991 RepID=A0A1H4C1M2_9BACT|nr:HAD-IIIA family hydrolase [Arachidicoccus rhizosphaerae]SEA54227.1 D-glycero-D-manno-heptose 1,7-bisphosphate phosphatase/D-glycero-alpha-D-manno-heptose 1-phosphate guanylyltransferase [Arachidicoccus rhizosphaerae]
MDNTQTDNEIITDIKASGLPLKIDKSWTLFLDRDGVINEDHVGWYTLSIDEFRLYEGAKEAMVQFARQFGRIVICTNQRCIGRGLLTEQGLADIHAYLMKLIGPDGGRIDHFYYAKELSDTDPLRKPNPGMALQAKKDFPEIDFSKSVMVGNNPSDMEFAMNAAIRHKVFLNTTIDEPPMKDGEPISDFNYPSLKAFADHIKVD